VVLIDVCTPPRHNIYDVRKVSSVDQALIDLVENASIWGVPGLEVDSFVHEVRTFDPHLPASGKLDQSDAIIICTLMQVVLAYRWLMYGFPDNFCVRVSPASAVHKIDRWPPLLSHLLVHVC
jgi:hypothetical protein